MRPDPETLATEVCDWVEAESDPFFFNIPERRQAFFDRFAPLERVEIDLIMAEMIARVTTPDCVGQQETP
jgi:hypothetical protein